ncbi:Receptor serine/threonine-protein kinase SD1-8 [Spatholobus suberectus]|nr:Receptor serine/threonine-protein kinase SD1-8 [Spatholobus suberectus]
MANMDERNVHITIRSSASVTVSVNVRQKRRRAEPVTVSVTVRQKRRRAEPVQPEPAVPDLNLPLVPLDLPDYRDDEEQACSVAENEGSNLFPLYVYLDYDYGSQVASICHRQGRFLCIVNLQSAIKFNGGGDNGTDTGTGDSDKKKNVGNIARIAVTVAIVILGGSDALLPEVIFSNNREHSDERKIDDLELPLINFNTITESTNFFLANKLGEGGFGSIYKGRLVNGQEIVVIRLSSSGQGNAEFKNEVRSIAKVQHQNLV